MRQLIALLLTLCVTFSAFTGAAILVGRHQPPSEHLTMLSLTDCAPPCWIGIIPGDTMLSDAISRIKSHYVALPNYQSTFSESPTSFVVQVSRRDNANDTVMIVIRSYPNNRVSTIGFNITNSASGPNIAELSNVLGPPTSIFLPSINAYTLAFSKLDCITATTAPAPDNHTSALQHPNVFYFGEPGGCDVRDKQPPWQPWRGFQSIAAYAH